MDPLIRSTGCLLIGDERRRIASTPAAEAIHATSNEIAFVLGGNRDLLRLDDIPGSLIDFRAHQHLAALRYQSRMFYPFLGCGGGGAVVLRINQCRSRRAGAQFSIPRQEHLK